MKRLFVSLSLVILAGLSLTACMALDVQSQAIASLAGMDASEYFQRPAQIALAQGITEGDKAQMRQALDHGADVNQVGREGIMPLFWAMIKNNLAAFKFLLNHGANPNAVTQTSDGSRAYAIELAFKQRSPAFLRALLEHGADPNTIVYKDSNATLLFYHQADSRLAQIKLLAKHGANVNHRAIYNTTSLLDAVMGEEYETALFLLRAGADPTIANSVNGSTAIGSIKYMTKNYRTGGACLGKGKCVYYDDVVQALKKRGYLDEDFKAATDIE